MQRDDPPRGPRKPYSGHGPRKDTGAGTGQGAGQGAGQGPWRSGPRRDDEQRPPRQGAAPPRAPDASGPYRAAPRPPAGDSPYRNSGERRAREPAAVDP